jgi:hypothetical protein
MDLVHVAPDRAWWLMCARTPRDSLRVVGPRRLSLRVKIGTGERGCFVKSGEPCVPAPDLTQSVSRPIELLGRPLDSNLKSWVRSSAGSRRTG